MYNKLRKQIICISREDDGERLEIFQIAGKFGEKIRINKSSLSVSEAQWLAEKVAVYQCVEATA